MQILYYQYFLYFQYFDEDHLFRKERSYYSSESEGDSRYPTDRVNHVPPP